MYLCDIQLSSTEDFITSRTDLLKPAALFVHSVSIDLQQLVAVLQRFDSV